MSTLEKTISILNDMPEKQIEIVYSYVSFLKKQSEKEKGQNQQMIFQIHLSELYLTMEKLQKTIKTKGLLKNMELMIDTNVLLDIMLKRGNQVL